eukprot:m.153504 g.153504  ORF g.153504 m.153504 type:complete len:2205 (+) comp10175_c0_seq2:1525-8139(+)
MGSACSAQVHPRNSDVIAGALAQGGSRGKSLLELSSNASALSNHATAAFDDDDARSDFMHALQLLKQGEFALAPDLAPSNARSHLGNIFANLAASCHSLLMALGDGDADDLERVLTAASIAETLHHTANLLFHTYGSAGTSTLKISAEDREKWTAVLAEISDELKRRKTLPKGTLEFHIEHTTNCIALLRDGNQEGFKVACNLVTNLVASAGSLSVRPELLSSIVAAVRYGAKRTALELRRDICSAIFAIDLCAWRVCQALQNEAVAVANTTADAAPETLADTACKYLCAIEKQLVRNCNKWQVLCAWIDCLARIGLVALDDTACKWTRLDRDKLLQLVYEGRDDFKGLFSESSAYISFGEIADVKRKYNIDTGSSSTAETSSTSGLAAVTAARVGELLDTNPLQALAGHLCRAAAVLNNAVPSDLVQEFVTMFSERFAGVSASLELLVLSENSVAGTLSKAKSIATSSTVSNNNNLASGTQQTHRAFEELSNVVSRHYEHCQSLLLSTTSYEKQLGVVSDGIASFCDKTRFVHDSATRICAFLERAIGAAAFANQDTQVLIDLMCGEVCASLDALIETVRTELQGRLKTLLNDCLDEAMSVASAVSEKVRERVKRAIDEAHALAKLLHVAVQKLQSLGAMAEKLESGASVFLQQQQQEVDQEQHEQGASTVSAAAATAKNMFATFRGHIKSIERTYNEAGALFDDTIALMRQRLMAVSAQGVATPSMVVKTSSTAAATLQCDSLSNINNSLKLTISKILGTLDHLLTSCQGIRGSLLDALRNALQSALASCGIGNTTRGLFSQLLQAALPQSARDILEECVTYFHKALHLVRMIRGASASCIDFVERAMGMILKVKQHARLFSSVVKSIAADFEAICLRVSVKAQDWMKQAGNAPNFWLSELKQQIDTSNVRLSEALTLATSISTMTSKTEAIVAMAREILAHWDAKFSKITGRIFTLANQIVLEHPGFSSLDETVAFVRDLKEPLGDIAEGIGAALGDNIGNAMEGALSDAIDAVSEGLDCAADAYRQWAPLAGQVYDVAKHFFPTGKWRVRAACISAAISLQNETKRQLQQQAKREAEVTSSKTSPKAEAQSAVADVASVFSLSKVSLRVSASLTRAKAMETDARVQQILLNPALAHQMQDALRKAWPSAQQKLKKDVESSLAQLQSLQEEIASTPNPAQKEQLVAIHRAEQQALRARIDNLSGIGQQLGVVISFLEDMRQTLNRIESKVDAIKEKLDQAADDIATVAHSGPKQLIANREARSLWTQAAGGHEEIGVEFFVRALQHWFMVNLSDQEHGQYLEKLNPDTDIPRIVDFIAGLIDERFLDTDLALASAQTTSASMISVIHVNDAFPPSESISKSLSRLSKQSQDARSRVIMLARHPEPLPYFCGRLDEVESLASAITSYCKRPTPTTNHNHLCVQLYGHGGLGKTSLAVWLANHFENMHFFPGGIAFLNLAGVHYMGEVAALLYEVWGKKSMSLDVGSYTQELYRLAKSNYKPFLLVLDNVEEELKQEGLLQLLINTIAKETSSKEYEYSNQANHSCVLLTTREELEWSSENDSHLDFYPTRPLSHFGVADAEALLLAVSDVKFSRKQFAAVTKLLKVCGHLPAAVHLVGRTCNVHAIKPDALFERVTATLQDMQSELRADDGFPENPFESRKAIHRNALPSFRRRVSSDSEAPMRRTQRTEEDVDYSTDFRQDEYEDGLRMPYLRDDERYLGTICIIIVAFRFLRHELRRALNGLCFFPANFSVKEAVHLFYDNPDEDDIAEMRRDVLAPLVDAGFLQRIARTQEYNISHILREIITWLRDKSDGHEFSKGTSVHVLSSIPAHYMSLLDDATTWMMGLNPLTAIRVLRRQRANLRVFLVNPNAMCALPRKQLSKLLREEYLSMLVQTFSEALVLQAVMKHPVWVLVGESVRDQVSLRDAACTICSLGNALVKGAGQLLQSQQEFTEDSPFGSTERILWGTWVLLDWAMKHAERLKMTEELIEALLSRARLALLIADCFAKSMPLSLEVIGKELVVQYQSILARDEREVLDSTFFANPMHKHSSAIFHIDLSLDRKESFDYLVAPAMTETEWLNFARQQLERAQKFIESASVPMESGQVHRKRAHLHLFKSELYRLSKQPSERDSELKTAVRFTKMLLEKPKEFVLKSMSSKHLLMLSNHNRNRMYMYDLPILFKQIDSKVYGENERVFAVLGI